MPASWRCCGKAERARVDGHGLVEDGTVAVEAAQLHVIVDQLRDQRESRILEIGGGCGGIGLAGGNLVANLPPQVELVADAAADGVGVVVGRRGGTPERRVERFAIALDAGAETQRGKQSRARLIASALACA